MISVYERALSAVGDANQFQKNFDYVFNVGLVASWSIAYYSILLCLVVVPYTCQIPEKPNNFSDYEWKLNHLPTFVDLTGEVKFESCRKYSNPGINNDTHACDKYEYDKTWYELTVGSEYDWVCDKEIYVANILAFIKVSEALGSVAFGVIGDVYGRRPAILISLLMLIIGRFVSLIGKRSYIVFAFGCVFASLSSWSIPQSTLVLSMEISAPKRRTTTSTFRLVSTSIGMAIMALLYWWLREWKMVMIVTTLPLIPFVICTWKSIESPSWLYSKGKYSKCVKNLKRIAKVNKKELDEDIMRELLTFEPVKDTLYVNPMVIFAGKRLTINTILQLVLWTSVNISYNVLILQSGEKKDGNPFLEFAWQCLVEVPANFVAAWMADHWGRRKSSIIACVIVTLVWILFTFKYATGYVWLSYWWIDSLIMTVCRLSTSIACYVLNLLCIEIYPTCLRQLGSSIGFITFGGASAIAPYILYLGRKFDDRLSGTIMIITSAVGIIASPLLPETLNRKLPETIEEAQRFGARERKVLTLINEQ